MKWCTTEEEAQRGKGETGEEDAGEDDEEGAPEEPAPGNDVASLPTILHLAPLSKPERATPRIPQKPLLLLFDSLKLIFIKFGFWFFFFF